MVNPLTLERFQQRNRAYYNDLRRLHQQLVAPGLRVLEIGCGLGDLLASLKPGLGVGVEAEPALAAAAQARHPSTPCPMCRRHWSGWLPCATAARAW